ncbi:MAG: type II toxin-antitoxin system RelE/ParE family toxin [Flavobacteriales bacterium]|jgi:toxin ParE1/3/4|nr:type II toxin-antitoxin system RelE/ParE family toxin [Flavobacteriales bacterium]MBK6882962.1 type II toxin-antitoxin system RelE/ParE family toxin [Flavobacteriales bacterium]MBK7102673.1 type II toxin-antitoxin system RelE/ParE family toxin [Flavobacteriales bacterium]MBK7114301.1 type II toxin-antitoxin system RelE/ParE family toxin [Flavobacteriales bacterium]
MALNVFWTQFARDKLQDIHDHYAYKAGPRVAKKLISGIVDRTILLSDHPKAGPVENLLSSRPEAFRSLLFKNYKLIYRINTEKMRIDVVHVFDTRQDPKKLSEFR